MCLATLGEVLSSADYSCIATPLNFSKFGILLLFKFCFTNVLAVSTALLTTGTERFFKASSYFFKFAIISFRADFFGSLSSLFEVLSLLLEDWSVIFFGIIIYWEKEASETSELALLLLSTWGAEYPERFIAEMNEIFDAVSTRCDTMLEVIIDLSLSVM